jgi:CheY-like chemotaxis protein
MDATEAREDPLVLVVDDDDDLRALAVRVVKQAGYDVDAVSDGQAGLDRLAERTYDLIVCDLRMPRMDGVTFYREVQRRNPVAARRFVFMTTHGKAEEYRDFLWGVRAPVLNKPFTLDEFRSTLAPDGGAAPLAGRPALLLLPYALDLADPEVSPPPPAAMGTLLRLAEHRARGCRAPGRPATP